MRKIAIVTGTRAEYGLLYWVIKAVHEDPELELQLIVTGMHLSPEFGYTVRVIENDGFPIAAKVEMLLSSDTAVGISKSMGLAMISFADVYNDFKPDMVLLLGDRFEIFSACTAAMIARIPIAHCHGGESSEGSIDESIRHAITKMSHLHFTAAAPYRDRVIQLGEQPDRVFLVGALGIENLNRITLLSREELEKSLGIVLRNEILLVTFHPVTLENATSEDQFKALLYALGSEKDVTIVFTRPNADTDGRIIIKLIDDFVGQYKDRSFVFTSLGQLRYLSMLKCCAVVIGNSSSGLIEAPSFKVPTINIGDRQRGRLQADSVIQCKPDAADISRAIHLARSKAFRATLANVENPYGNKNVSTLILPVIKQFPLDNILKKEFYVGEK